MTAIEALRSLSQQAFDNAKSVKQQEKNKTNFNIIEKELKSLSILKECYDCGMIQLRITVDKYYIDFLAASMEISEEQYYLLYEVFEHEQKN